MFRFGNKVDAELIVPTDIIEQYKLLFLDTLPEANILRNKVGNYDDSVFERIIGIHKKEFETFVIDKLNDKKEVVVFFSR